MSGKTLFIGFAIFLALFTGGLFYTINYAYYASESLEYLERDTDFGPITLKNVDLISSDRTPLKMRICADAIDETKFEPSTQATPLNAPFWFRCFNSKTLTQELASGNLKAYKIETNTPYGFDLYLAQNEEKSYIWRQLNECGDAQFSGKALPAICPEFKE